MKKFFGSLLAAAVFGLFSMAAIAEATKENAVAMVKAAAEMVRKGGKEALVQEVNKKSGKWFQGELYLIVLSLDGIHLAHPTNPRLIGKSMLDLPDIDGRLFRKERVEVANKQGEGWVDYKYKNPASGAIEHKTLYVLKAGDVILSAGVYK